MRDDSDSVSDKERAAARPRRRNGESEGAAAKASVADRAPIETASPSRELDGQDSHGGDSYAAPSLQVEDGAIGRKNVNHGSHTAVRVGRNDGATALSAVQAAHRITQLQERKFELSFLIGGEDHEGVVEEMGRANREEAMLREIVDAQREEVGTGEVEQDEEEEDGYGADGEEDATDAGLRRNPRRKFANDVVSAQTDQFSDADEDEDDANADQQPSSSPTSDYKPDHFTGSRSRTAHNPSYNSCGSTKPRRARTRKWYDVDEVLYSDDGWLKVTFLPDSEGKSYPPGWVRKADCNAETLAEWARMKTEGGGRA